MFLLFYFRLRRIRAAAIATIMTTAAPMAMYVVVGDSLDGGIMTGLGVGAIVDVGAVVGGVIEEVEVGAGVAGVEAGTADGALDTTKDVSASDP